MTSSSNRSSGRSCDLVPEVSWCEMTVHTTCRSSNPPTARPRTKAISDRRDGACPLDHPRQLLTVSPMKSNQPVLEKFIPMRGRGPLSMPESRALWWEMFQNAFTLGTFQGKCAGSECWHNYSWCKWLSARFPCCSIFPREMFLTERKYWLC